MKRTLAMLRLLFAHSWPVALMSGLAVLSLVIGVFSGPRFVMGNVFVIFSILWASAAFRQLASTGRLALLPGFRAFAVAALFTVAAAIGAVAALAAILNSEPSVPSGFIETGLLAFALASAYCLLAQWVSTSRAPLLFQLILVLLAVRYVSSGDVNVSPLAENAWALALVALLGWLWLLVSAQRGTNFAGPHPMLHIEHMSGIRPVQWPLGAMFGVGPLDLGRSSHPAGTLMRGGNDAWVNRIGAAVGWVVGFALFWILWMYAIGASSGWQAGTMRTAPILTFLAVSFVATAVQAPARFYDWPARLRYVWLRTPGDRATLWRALERTIVTEAATVAAITFVVSAVLLLARSTPVELLLAYVLGCTVATLIGAYGAMGMRISGASVMAISICGSLGWVPVFWILMAARWELIVLYPLLLVFIVLTAVTRYRTRRRFLRMDWCAVKPWRDPLASARS